MSNELKELIEQQTSYYNHHTVEAILEKHPQFVVDDYKKLLTALEKELAQ
jgi:hypothetical protein